MGKFIARAIRSFAGQDVGVSEVKPRAAVASKVQPKVAVGASAGPGETTKATTVRRKRRQPTQTIMTAPAGDTSQAQVEYKKLLGA